MKVKTMKNIHTFRKDHTTQVISCKPWTSRLHPYPSLVRKVQTYLELKDQNADHTNLSSNLSVRPPTFSPQKAPVFRKPIDKKKKRSKQPNRRQFKVRVIKKPLPPPSTSIIAKPTTTATAIQTHNDEAIIHVHKMAYHQTYPISLTVYKCLV